MAAIVLLVFFYVMHISNKIDTLNDNLNQKYKTIIELLPCFKENQQYIVDEIEELRKEIKCMK